jgi:hypothetical protein
MKAEHKCQIGTNRKLRQVVYEAMNNAKIIPFADTVGLEQRSEWKGVRNETPVLIYGGGNDPPCIPIKFCPFCGLEL